MTNTFTYNFTNQDGYTSDIVIVAASMSTNDSNNGLGYDVMSIAGTFDGKVITGMEGASGENQYDENIGPWDNVIFTDSTQGACGSTDGIDSAGIAFRTADGQAYSIYSLGGEFDDQTQMISGYTLSLDSYGSPTSDPPPACYCLGTHILTSRGEILVENLMVSDLAVTPSGNLKSIKWIGHRRVDATRHSRPELVYPVRIEAGALGENRPVRDLLVSPEHALWLENAMLPAHEIINGATIRQENWRYIHYFHVELEDHDLLLAEGVPAESYLDCDNRSNFDNASEGIVALHPDWRVRAAARAFASGALTVSLHRTFVKRALELGRGAEISAFCERQRARALVTRTNFVRNARCEDSVRGLLGAGGRAPTHWWLSAPEGIVILILGSSCERDLPCLDLRFIGFARAPGSCCIYPEPGTPAKARTNQDWTFSCYLRQINGTPEGVHDVNLYIDECDRNGAYLTGQGYSQRLPTADDLMYQRMSATRRMTRPDVAVIRAYVQIMVAADTLIDMTLRIAGTQIEEGDYPSELILPPSGAHIASTRNCRRDICRSHTKRRIA